MSINHLSHAFSQELRLEDQDKQDNALDAVLLDSLRIHAKETRVINLHAIGYESQLEAESHFRMSLEKNNRSLSFSLKGIGSASSFILEQKD